MKGMVEILLCVPVLVGVILMSLILFSRFWKDVIQNISAKIKAVSSYFLCCSNCTIQFVKKVTSVNRFKRKNRRLVAVFSGSV